MKSKLLNLGLLFTSLIGYHEWGADKSSFIFQMEWEVISKMIKDFSSGLHPLVLLPMLGQIFLLYTLFQKEPGKVITFLGMGMIGLLLLMMFLIGLFSLNLKVVLSFLPFFTCAVLTILHFRRPKAQQA
jgi:uncharacterized protein YacL